MSCTTNQQAVTKQAAAGAGVSALASKSSYTAGLTPAAAVPLTQDPAVRPAGKRKQASRKSQTAGKRVVAKKEKSTTTKPAGKPVDPKKKKSATAKSAGKPGGAKKKKSATAKPANKPVTAKQKKSDAATQVKKPDKPSAAKPKKSTAVAKSPPQTTKKTKQQSFFATAASNKKVRPAQRQITITNDFSPEELQALSVQLRYGSAAVARAIKESRSKVNLGIGHSDPRPMDWAKQDQKHFQLLLDQLVRVRYRGQKQIDLSSLNDKDLVDLYEFAQFEAERHQRNIDHINGKLSHLGGPTAEYMVSRHKLQARFQAYLADNLEPFITLAMLDDAEMYSFD